MDKTLVSVIIPVHNGGLFLKEAVGNVMHQDYDPVEIIIVDDGSTDGTETLVRDLGDKVVYIRQENKGPASARNSGLKRARGNIIGFLDVDDVWSPDKLDIQTSYLADNPHVDIALGLSQPMKLVAEKDGQSSFEEWLSPFRALLLGAALFRSPVFEKVGLFDETFHQSEDTDWYMRARELGVRMAVMPQVTLFYRRHMSNISLDKQSRDRFFVRALKKSLDRRRAEEGTIKPIPKLPRPADIAERTGAGNTDGAI